MVDRLTNLIAIFENPALDFSKNRAEGDDILGDAYEYLIRHFATESGKSKGQFYTPAEVSRIMAQVIGLDQAASMDQPTVYDPTCGSGSLLIKAADEAANALWNLDALFEKTFAGAGTLDIEGVFYGFGGADQGTSFLLLASFLFPNQVGIGQLQPMLSVQRVGWSDGDAFGGVAAPVDEDASLLTIDAGLHYVISGHNARFSFAFRHTSLSVADNDSVTDTDIIFGGQIQAF